MKDDRTDILPRLVRLANISAFDYPRSFKSILRLLCRHFRLDDATFLLWDPGKKFFCQLIEAKNQELFVSCTRRPGRTPEGHVIRAGRFELQNGAAYLPVGNLRHRYGVLILHSPRLNSRVEIPSEFETICDLLSGMAQYALLAQEEQLRLEQLELLSALGHELNRANTFKELSRAVLRAALRPETVIGVVLRPVHGGTLFDRPHARLRPEYRALRAALLALEEDFTAKAAKGEAALLYRRLEKTRTPSGNFPELCLIIPLLFQGRMGGFLTLFISQGDGSPLFSSQREGKKFLLTVGSQIAQAMERVAAFEKLELLSAENDRKLSETTALYQVSRAMHSTLRLNELIHLILSAIILPEKGGFERAMLFLLNERTETLQGMLGVTRDTAQLVLPPVKGDARWDRPPISAEALEIQQQTPFCRLVKQQRLPLQAEGNALAWAARQGRVIFVPRPELEPPSGKALADTLQLAPFACAPLKGRHGTLGVLVVDNPVSRIEITPDRLRFLQLFANQAGAAMENSMLVHRLEQTHHDLREAQEQLMQGEKMAVLGEMAASVAHELKNPLVAIGGFAQRLSKISEQSSRQQEYSGIISREVRRMEEMLANILAFSKKQMLCFSRFQINDIIEEALSLESFTIARHEIRLDCALTPHLPLLWGDEQKLRQVVINLIANACQAMEGGGTLTVRSRSSLLRRADAVAVEIEDTGGGIPDHTLRNIFNPFFSTKEKGTGLGLSIVHRIVEHHQGEIEVQNTAQGALFIVRLPVGENPQLSVDKSGPFG